jgi:hypothetical protein
MKTAITWQYCLLCVSSLDWWHRSDDDMTWLLKGSAYFVLDVMWMKSGDCGGLKARPQAAASNKKKSFTESRVSKHLLTPFVLVTHLSA